MRISTKGRYGLRAVIDLALHYSQGPVSIRAIAEREGISDSYLEQVFSALKKGGLVKASRGANGGYTLAVAPGKITAGKVIKLLEGDLSPVFCVEKGENSSDEDKCKNASECRAYPFWCGLDRVVDEYVESITIKQLAENRGKL